MTQRRGRARERDLNNNINNNNNNNNYYYYYNNAKVNKSKKTVLNN